MDKGQYDLGRKAIYMIIVVFVLIFIFFYMSILMNNYYAKSVVDSDRISSELIASNLITSPSCLAYHDSRLFRTYLGVVDMSKFTEKLGACLPYNERPFKLTIAGKTVNYGVKDDAKVYKVERPVLIKNETGLFPALMILEDGYVR